MTPVDVARMREVAMGDEEFLRELIALYLDDTPSQIDALRHSVESHDSSAVQKGAHRLKGASTNIGALPLSELCWKMEQLGKGGNLEQAPTLLADIEGEYARLQDYLAHLQS